MIGNAPPMMRRSRKLEELASLTNIVDRCTERVYEKQEFCALNLNDFFTPTKYNLARSLVGFIDTFCANPLHTVYLQNANGIQLTVHEVKSLNAFFVSLFGIMGLYQKLLFVC